MPSTGNYLSVSIVAMFVTIVMIKQFDIEVLGGGVIGGKF